MPEAREIARRKKLKIWNGRGHAGRGQHFYVCAKSGKQAVELLKKAGKEDMTYRELKDYFNPNCWGDAMEGIEPEIGVWEGNSLKTAVPVRVA